MLFIVTALSFLDRQILSMSIIKIKRRYSHIRQRLQLDHQWVYSRLCPDVYIGWVFIDKFGTKLGLALSLAIWTVASGLHSIATTVSAFVIFRFILGIGEGACFPGVIKGVIEWIPAQKRSLATGVAIGGSAIGAVIAPLMVIFMLDNIGWRSLFLVTPIISFIWIGFWLFFNNKKNQCI